MTLNLGISLACSVWDQPFAGACISSIRMFAPSAPICLIVDESEGRVETRSLERTYDVSIIRREDVRDAGLRKHSFGYGITKMIGFWEAPFERVLHVDPDAVWWGDIRQNLPSVMPDVVYNSPHELITPYIQRTQYFDPDKLFRIVPEFDWQSHLYFNTGVLCVRRGSLDLDEYLRMQELQRNHPDILMTGEQGMLNILVFRGVTEKRLSAEAADLQTVVPVIAKELLERRFQFREGEPVVTHPTVIHWAGPKPWFSNRSVYSAPMTYFLRRAARETGSPMWHSATVLRLVREIQARLLPRVKRRLKAMVSRTAGERRWDTAPNKGGHS